MIAYSFEMNEKKSTSKRSALANTLEYIEQIWRREHAYGKIKRAAIDMKICIAHGLSAFMRLLYLSQMSHTHVRGHSDNCNANIKHFLGVLARETFYDKICATVFFLLFQLYWARFVRQCACHLLHRFLKYALSSIFVVAAVFRLLFASCLCVVCLFSEQNVIIPFW